MVQMLYIDPSHMLYFRNKLRIVLNIEHENLRLKFTNPQHNIREPEGSRFNSYYTNVLGRALLLSLDCSTLPLIHILYCGELSKEVSMVTNDRKLSLPDYLPIARVEKKTWILVFPKGLNVKRNTKWLVKDLNSGHRFHIHRRKLLRSERHPNNKDVNVNVI